MDWSSLPAVAASLGVALDVSAVENLRALKALVLEANSRLNLTRVTEEGAFLEKHVLDSLAALALGGASFVDVGAGGGFPGLAIAIARPEARVVLVEAIQKKAAFIAEAAQRLGLERVEVLAARAEDAARTHRDDVERGLARAVGTVPLCLEYVLPFIKVGGAAVLHRGPEDAAAELELARRVAPLLGGGPPEVRDYALPSGDRRRFLIVPKAAPTPAGFPRRTGVAAKKPLG